MLNPVDQTQPTESSEQSALLKARLHSLEATVSDLSTRLEIEGEERRRLGILLAKSQVNAHTPWILYVIALSTLTAAAISIYHLLKA